MAGATTAGSSPFPPIAQYGFLSDCETCALVAPSGAVEWLCLPRFDSPSVFGAILDRDAGTVPRRPGRRRACPRTAATCPARWCSRRAGACRGGWIIVRDVMLIGPWHHEADRSGTHRRSPTDYDADHVLLRCVRCVNGEVQVLLDCEPVFDYGRQAAQWEYTGPGYHEARATRRGHRRRALPDHGHERRLRGLARHGAHADEGRRHARSSRSRGRITRRPEATTRPTSGWCGPRTTGSTGSTTASSPTTRGAPTCSAARSR